jgi:flagellar biosynthesis chaperone FliJ
MSYPLHDLQRVRSLREAGAARALAHARREQGEAEATVRERQRALHDYHRNRLARETALYEDLRGRKVGLPRLDEVKNQVVTWRTHELQMEAALEQAETALAEAEAALEQARLDYRKAHAGSRKLDLHRERWQEQDRRERARLADEELDEFRVRPREVFRDEVA